jgi:hypothetical protein
MSMVAVRAASTGAALAIVLSAAVAAGQGNGAPTCSTLEGFAAVHGQHIIRDYVTGVPDDPAVVARSKAQRRRSLRLEQLEPRWLLNVDWRNPVYSLDVNADGRVDLALDYADFADAFGGGWSSRLRLVM